MSKPHFTREANATSVSITLSLFTNDATQVSILTHTPLDSYTWFDIEGKEVSKELSDRLESMWQAHEKALNLVLDR